MRSPGRWRRTPFAGSPPATAPALPRAGLGGTPSISAVGILRRVVDHKLATVVAVVAVADLVVLLAMGRVFDALMIFAVFGVGVSAVGFRRDEGRSCDTLLSWGTVALFSLVILGQAVGSFLATGQFANGPQIVGRIIGIAIGTVCVGVFLVLIPALLFRSYGFFRPAAGVFLVIASMEFAVALLAASIAANRGVLINWDKGWPHPSASAQSEGNRAKRTRTPSGSSSRAPAGRFSVQFPGRPIERRNSADPSLHEVIYETDEIVYIVTYSDLPPTTTSADAILDGTMAGLTVAMHVKPLETDKVTLSGVYPGRHVRGRDPEGHSFELLLYLVENRLYQVMVIATGSREICRRDAQVPAVLQGAARRKAADAGSRDARFFPIPLSTRPPRAARCERPKG